MTDTTYTPEVMNQAGRIYDKLEQIPADDRPLMKLIAEAFIDGLTARERLAAERPGA